MPNILLRSIDMKAELATERSKRHLAGRTVISVVARAAMQAVVTHDILVYIDLLRQIVIDLWHR